MEGGSLGETPASRPSLPCLDDPGREVELVGDQGGVGAEDVLSARVLCGVDEPAGDVLVDQALDAEALGPGIAPSDVLELVGERCGGGPLPQSGVDPDGPRGGVPARLPAL